MPIALIEAQLAGIPVVATDVGSNSEVVASGETGLIVEKNAAAIAMAISQLAVDSKLRAKMGRAARERALQVFNPEAMIATHGELYLALFRPAT